MLTRPCSVHSPVNPVSCLPSFACKTCQAALDTKHHISCVPPEEHAFELRNVVHNKWSLDLTKVNIISPHTQTLQNLSGIMHYFAEPVS